MGNYIWIVKKIKTVRIDVVYWALIMPQCLGQMFSIHYFISSFQITFQEDATIICQVPEAEHAGPKSQLNCGPNCLPLTPGNKIGTSKGTCFSNLFTAGKSKAQPKGVMVWPRDKVKDLGSTIPGPWNVHTSLALMTPPAVLSPRESDPRNTPPAGHKGWVSSCLPNWTIIFLIFPSLIEKYSVITLNAFERNIPNAGGPHVSLPQWCLMQSFRFWISCFIL